MCEHCRSERDRWWASSEAYFPVTFVSRGLRCAIELRESDWWMNRGQVSRRGARSPCELNHTELIIIHHADGRNKRPVTLESALSERFFFFYWPWNWKAVDSTSVTHRCVIFSALNLLCKLQIQHDATQHVCVYVCVCTNNEQLWKVAEIGTVCSVHFEPHISDQSCFRGRTKVKHV